MRSPNLHYCITRFLFTEVFFPQYNWGFIHAQSVKIRRLLEKSRRLCRYSVYPKATSSVIMITNPIITPQVPR